MTTTPSLADKKDANEQAKAEEKVAEQAADKATAIAKAEADFQADMQKATDKRNAVLSKYTEDTFAARAWDITKAKESLPFAQCPPDLQQRLEYIAADVVKTGIANTPFELKVAELNSEKKKAAKA